MSISPCRISRSSDVIEAQHFSFSEEEISQSGTIGFYKPGIPQYNKGKLVRETIEDIELDPIVRLKVDEDLNTFEELWDIEGNPNEMMRFTSEIWLQRQYVEERTLDIVWIEEEPRVYTVSAPKSNTLRSKVERAVKKLGEIPGVNYINYGALRVTV